MNKDKLRDKYLNSAESFRLLKASEEKLLLILSVLRLITFTGGYIIAWFAFTRNISLGISIFSVVTIIFLYLLKLYSSHSKKKDFLGNLESINRNEAAAVKGDYSAFDSGSIYLNASHDFSNDVDLFGDSSLFQYMNRTVTGYGRDLLAHWLSDPYRLSSQLGQRQEAVKELALKEKWRHEFMASGIGKSLDKNNIEGLLSWMKEQDFIKSSPVKKFLIYFLPAASILVGILVTLGIIHYSLFILLILLNLLFVAAGLKTINTIHSVLSRKYNYLSSMNELLNIFEKGSFTSVLLNDIKNNITGNKVSAAVSVKKLGSLIQTFDARLNMLVIVILNGLLLWDYHSVLRLEKWKYKYRDLFSLWLQMTAEADAFISLGNYAANNPDFAYPSVSGKNTVLIAKNLGHQLIEEDKRVCNDFSLERKGIICIVSGANMAGKSTFLRTIAVNYILGMAGAPVCASEMSFIPLKLFTSMRTTDSLLNNESYFYAELKRLKHLKIRIESGEPVLFILDEILKGTNSADKSMGSKLFIRRLTELDATGLIATHDTSVGEMENEYRGKIINKCFEIEIDGDKIKFDYILREGITHKMNAALLMKQMGILD